MSDVATALLQLIGRSEPAADPALAAVKLARASLDALVLRLGQSIDAKVTAQLAGGLTQLTADGETFVLKLETPLPVNTVVTLKITPSPTGQPAVTVTVQPQPAVAQPAPPAPPALPPLPQPVTAATVPAPPVQLAGAPPAAVAPLSPGAPVLAPGAAPFAAVPLAPAVSLPAEVQPPGLPAQAPTIPTPPAPAQPSGTPTPLPPVTVQLAPAPAPAAQALPPTPAAQAPAPAPAQPPPAQLTPTQPAPAHPAPAQPASAQPAPAATIAQPARPATVSTPPIPAAAPTQPATAQLSPAAPTVPVSNTPATSHPMPPVVQPQVATAAPSAKPVSPGGPVPAIAPQLTGSPAPPPPAPAATPTLSLPPPTVVSPISIPRSGPTPASPPLAQILADPVQAAARQDSILPLIARLATLAAPTAAALPRPALEAIAMLLGTRLDLNRAPPDGKTLRDAVLRTGIITEPGTRTSTDAKSALLQLRSALSGFLGGEVEAVAPVTRRPPPPLKGEPVRAPSAQSAPPSAEEPVETARQLLGHADAALSRAKLLQLASNPADAARPATAAPAAEFRVEVPMQLGAETGILQLLVERDGKHKRSPTERGWRMRFALNFTATGEVGAEVALLGRSANVALWAADPATADALEAALPELAPALARLGLDVGSVRVRRGAPPPAARAPGQLLDSAR
ncbi:MAG TPA: flagellar hook-length control protein FliK [Devosia sp.]|jgi:hypothetical protein|nr:flagellar hook-length control protein FliK [Devosia sp.]